jgi:hypothetical protein
MLMANAKKKPVPEFSSEDEERTFWAELPDPKPARPRCRLRA